MSITYALAVDFGGTKTEAALVDSSGVVLAESRFRALTGPTRSSDELAAAIEQVVLACAATLPRGCELLGAGIGSAGPVNEAEGTVSPLNISVWRNYPLRDQVAALITTAPVTLSMDGICIALAEHWVGAAKGYDNAMGMIVSTGIGGGLILHGNTVSGPTGNAGHIGHIEVGGFDDPCKCGGTGCVEAVASGPHTVAWANRQGWVGTSGEELGESFRAGDRIAAAAIERSGRAIGQAIASATALVDLEIVAIGGGFSRVSPVLFDHMRTAVASRKNFGFVTKVKVVPSGLSSDGPLIGAAALVHRANVVR